MPTPEFRRQVERYERGEIDASELFEWAQQHLTPAQFAEFENQMRQIDPSTLPQPGGGVRAGIGAAAQAAGAMRAGPPAARQAVQGIGRGRMAAGLGALGLGTAAVLGRGGEEDAGGGMAMGEIADLLEAGETPPIELIQRAQQEDPKAYAALWGDASPQQVFTHLGGAPQAGPRETPDEPVAGERLTFPELLRMLEADLMEQWRNPPMIQDADGNLVPDLFAKQDAFDNLLQVSQALHELENLEAGAVRLDDGTLITSDMLNHPDPALRAQFQQAFANRQAAIEHQATSILNQYQLDQFALDRGQVQDENARLIQEHNAQLANIRERLARDEIDIRQAQAEHQRLLQGLQESRARASLETETALAAAPWASPEGKAAFTGADLGAGVQTLMRQAGIADPETAEAIRFPGTITLDPRGAMQHHDSALGVTGPLQPVPGVSVTDAEIPRAPSLQPGPAPPTLRPPVTPSAIQLPPEVLAALEAALRAPHPRHDPAVSIPTGPRR